MFQTLILTELTTNIKSENLFRFKLITSYVHLDLIRKSVMLKCFQIQSFEHNRIC